MSVRIAESIWLHKCNRCDYEWSSRKKYPQTCSSCRSPYWNKPRLH